MNPSDNISFEVMPLPNLDSQLDLLPKGSLIGITCSSKRSIETTVDYARKLQALGFKTQPHLGARQIKDQDHLRQLTSDLKSVGVDDLLVLGGDAKEAVGIYDGAIDLLQDFQDLEVSFREIGVVGHPEGHPFLKGDEATANLLQKQRFIKELGANGYILTQMCGRAKIVIEWIKIIRNEGVNLPVLIGLPAPINSEEVLVIAKRVGVSESFSDLESDQSSTFPLTPLYKEIVEDLGFSKFNILGFQIFTFNNIERSVKWFGEINFGRNRRRDG